MNDETTTPNEQEQPEAGNPMSAKDLMAWIALRRAQTAADRIVADTTGGQPRKRKQYTKNTNKGTSKKRRKMAKASRKKNRK